MSSASRGYTDILAMQQVMSRARKRITGHKFVRKQPDSVIGKSTPHVRAISCVERNNSRRIDQTCDVKLLLDKLSGLDISARTCNREVEEYCSYNDVFAYISKTTVCTVSLRLPRLPAVSTRLLTLLISAYLGEDSAGSSFSLPLLFPKAVKIQAGGSTDPLDRENVFV